MSLMIVITFLIAIAELVQKNMNQTHLHLLVNHVGIIGSIFGGLVLIYGLWVKSSHTSIAGYWILIVSSIGAIATYATGEPAEETVESIPGISDTAIEAHEEFASIALVALAMLGIVSLVALYATIKKLSWAGKAGWAVAFISIVSFILIARTGYLGGQIRHTEINSSASALQHDTENEDDH